MKKKGRDKGFIPLAFSIEPHRIVTKAITTPI